LSTLARYSGSGIKF